MAFKFFAKNKNELETFIDTVRIFNREIGMEIECKKKSAGGVTTEGIELSNHQIRLID